ncbi:hypothetical protein T492DRAFT_844365 [Pavlovales sp. CCMP2436]|nr:hypothetical protein T492DRAFT_844365 [Pavlovales sp. CCMP2436]
MPGAGSLAVDLLAPIFLCYGPTERSKPLAYRLAGVGGCRFFVLRLADGEWRDPREVASDGGRLLVAVQLENWFLDALPVRRNTCNQLGFLHAGLDFELVATQTRRAVPTPYGLIKENLVWLDGARVPEIVHTLLRATIESVAKDGAMAAVAERARAVAAFLAGPFAAELALVDVGAAVLAAGARTGAGVASASAAVHASTPLPQLAALRPESAGWRRGAHGLPGIAGGILTTLLPLAATEWTVSAERCTLVGKDAAAVRSDMLASFGALAGHVDVGDGTAMIVRLRGLTGEGVRAGQAQVVAARAALAASGVRLDLVESLASYAARVLTGLAGGDLPGDWEGGASSESSDSDSDGEDRIHTHLHGCSCRARPPHAGQVRPATSAGTGREAGGARLPRVEGGELVRSYAHVALKPRATEPHERPHRRLRGDGSGKKEAAISSDCLVSKPQAFAAHGAQAANVAGRRPLRAPTKVQMWMRPLRRVDCSSRTASEPAPHVTMAGGDEIFKLFNEDPFTKIDTLGDKLVKEITKLVSKDDVMVFALGGSALAVPIFASIVAYIVWDSMKKA